jgi:hypothetical protein
MKRSLDEYANEMAAHLHDSVRGIFYAAQVAREARDDGVTDEEFDEICRRIVELESAGFRASVYIADEKEWRAYYEQLA